MPPKKIKFPSDDTELEFVEVVIDKKTKGKSYRYAYTKSIEWKHKEIDFEEKRFEKMLKNKIIIERN